MRGRWLFSNPVTYIVVYVITYTLELFKTVVQKQQDGMRSYKAGCHVRMSRYLKEELMWAVDKWFCFVCNVMLLKQTLKQYCMLCYAILGNM